MTYYIRKFPCAVCGGDVSFESGLNKLVCKCGTVKAPIIGKKELKLNFTKTGYGWIITRDMLYEEDPKSKSEVGITGPHGVILDEEIIKEKGQKFIMKDDDGNIYYEGYVLGQYSGFEPLDDFGTPNSGCTSIWYLENEVWVEL